MTELSKIFFIDDDELCIFLSETISNKVLPNSDKFFFTESPTALIELVKCRNEGIDLPDVIFLDLYMPHKNGFDFLKELKVLNIEVPVIIITSSYLSHDQARVKEFNVKDIIVKPLTSVRLEDALKKL